MLLSLNRLFLPLCLVPSLAWATPISNFSVTGTIQERVSIPVQGLDGSNQKSIFTEVAGPSFTSGAIETTNAIQLRNVNVNRPVDLKIRNAGWTLPAGYDTSSGTKQTDGSDGDLLIKVNASTLAAASGTVAIQGSYGSQYVAVSNNASTVLKLGTSSGGTTHGVSNGSVDVDAKISLNPTFDIPGNYSVTIELSVSDQ